MNIIDNDAYNMYFGKENTLNQSESDITTNFKSIVYDGLDAHRVHDKEITPGVEYNNTHLRMLADHNIDEIDQLANILKKLCNAAWGSDWGELSPDLKKGEDNRIVKLPQITIETNTREIDSDLGGLKPRLMQIIDEKDENGDKTGDCFLVYHQWFDYNIEFNFYGRTNKEARELRQRFEKLITVYTGYLKRQGISEMFFESETHPRCSLNYDERTFMNCIYYYVRFESVIPIRQSVINRINSEIGVSKLKTDVIKTVLEQSDKKGIDIDFFNGNTEITFIEDN